MLLSLGLRHFLKQIEEHVSTGHCHHVPLKDLVLRGSLDCTTPLLLACHFGDLKMVRHLIKKWGVDVNETAIYYENWECKIEGATPVFVAAYNRHFSIVKYLIRKGADLSLKTTCRNKFYHNMTPLLGAIHHAIYHDYVLPPKGFETIVIPLVRLLLENGASLLTFQDEELDTIWTELASYDANLTTLLIHHGMALDKQGSYGETVFHHWAKARLGGVNEEDSLTVVKLCVEKGANAMIRNIDGYTPILVAAQNLNWTVFEFLLEQGGMNRTGKIDAMEMAAAFILSKSVEYDSHVERAFGYLRRAFILRGEKPDPILKTPLTLESGRTIEWATIAEVEAGIQNPTEYKIQAYLTRLRICPGRTLNDPLSDCVSDLMKQCRFDDIRDVLLATFSSVRGDVVFTAIVVKHLISMMSQLKNEHHLFSAETFKKPLESILATNLFSFNHEGILIKLVAFLARNAEILIDKEIKKSLCKLLAQECEESRVTVGLKTLLHKACLNPEDFFASFSCPEPIPMQAMKEEMVPFTFLSNSIDVGW